MYGLTIQCADLAQLTAVLALLSASGTPATVTKAEKPAKKADAPKATPPADDGLNLGGPASDGLDDLLTSSVPAGPTADDVKNKLREVLGNPKYGKDTVTKILAKYGMQTVNDLKQDQHANIIATCVAVLSK